MMSKHDTDYVIVSAEGAHGAEFGSLWTVTARGVFPGKTVATLRCVDMTAEAVCHIPEDCVIYISPDAWWTEAKALIAWHLQEGTMTTCG